MKNILKAGRGTPSVPSNLCQFSAPIPAVSLPRLAKQCTRPISMSHTRTAPVATATATTKTPTTTAAAFEGRIDRRITQYYDHHQLSNGKPSQRLRSSNLDYTYVGFSGGEILHETLIKHDVKQIFGYPGRTVHEDPFQTIYKSRKLKSVLPRLEQGGGHMAEGYARATGKPGVVLTTSGPGITNLVTPMQDALCDGTPMVIFSSQSPTITHLNDEFQVADVLGISKPCTKWNIRVRAIDELPQRISEAFEIAISGRPGPVLVDIPKHVISNTLTHATPTTNLPPRPISAANTHAFIESVQLRDDTLDRVARLVNIAKKPILYVGQGMLAHPHGTTILSEFASKARIPVTTSLQGLGAFDELDPKALHMLGLHGSAYANLAMQEADLIIALGARFDDRITGAIPKFAPAALAAAADRRGGIVHFEIAPKNVNKVVQAVEAVLGDCAANLARLTPRVESVSARPEWEAQIRAWKARFPLDAYKRFPSTTTPGRVRAQAVIAKLSDMTAHMKQRTVITTGVGQHQMWAAQHFRWRHPRTMLTSGGLGTMGYGLPAAIGAKVARPECLVVDIDGDASFNMTMTELGTAAQYGIAVKVLLFNNEEMGMVSDLQRLYYSGVFAHNRQGNPNFVRAAEAFGVSAKRCIEQADVEEKLRWLIDHDGPALLEIVTEKNSPVWPVVPAGKGLHEFITYPEVIST